MFQIFGQGRGSRRGGWSSREKRNKGLKDLLLPTVSLEASDSLSFYTENRDLAETSRLYVND